MKKILYLLLAITLVACSSDKDDDVTKAFAAGNFTHSGCKSHLELRSNENSSPLGQEAVYISTIDKDGKCYLRIEHNDVQFNCASTKFGTKAMLAGNNIKISETEDTNSANCICPYDLNYEVGPLRAGTYTVNITQTIGKHDFSHPRIAFNVNIPANGSISRQQVKFTKL